MPTNTIKVEYKNGSVTCKVYDADGSEHDVTQHFHSIFGATSKKSIENTILFTPPTNSGFLESRIGFKAIEKEMEFKVSNAIIKQIMALE